MGEESPRETSDVNGIRSSQAAPAPVVAGKVTDLDKMRGMPWHVAGNCGTMAFCVLTVFGSVFVLFMDELGFDEKRIGILLSLIPFASVLAVLVTPLAVRFGVKRTFLSCFGVRYAIILGLLFTPFILDKFGTQKAFFWVMAILMVFAVLRAIGETAFTTWYPDLIPKAMLGRFSAIIGTISMLVSIVTVLIASAIIKRFDGIGKFQILIGIGSGLGLLGILCYGPLPGGRPVVREPIGGSHFRNMGVCLRDRNFLLFLGASGFVWLGTSAVFPFIALYMKKQIGLASDKVVLLEGCTYLGTFALSYLCGWLADRYGSRPLMITGVGMFLLLPILWFVMPRGYTWSLYPALLISVLVGFGGSLWGHAQGRYLFSTVISDDLRTAYTAIWVGTGGLLCGFGPLLGGWLLDICRGIEGTLWFFHFDAYTPLFAGGVVCLAASAVLLRYTSSDSKVSTGRFVRMFFQGNPVMAMRSLVRFRLAGDEVQRLNSTKQMAQAQNPLNAEELIEALRDPSFNIRYEAIVAISNMRPNRQLIDALLDVLNSGEADLAPTAAWALGKIGDKAAVSDLRKALVSDYPVMRSRGARALEMLGDSDSIPYLRDGLQNEREPAVRVAYAGALSRLGDPTVLTTVLTMLRETDDQTVRSELALAGARLVGNESQYTRLWRNTHQNFDITAGQTLLAIRKVLAQARPRQEHLASLAADCSERFAQDQLDDAVELLVQFIDEMPHLLLHPQSSELLENCAMNLKEFGSSRREYIVLALHTLKLEFTPRRTN